ncbi:hypothetical protein ACUSIJ_08245 [Pseudochelatococcus sp. B33]
MTHVFLPSVPLPSQLAGRLAARRDAIERQKDAAGILSAWRQTYIMSRKEARSKAREWMERPHRSAYVTEMESWRDLGDGRIECTVRRVPAD